MPDATLESMFPERQSMRRLKLTAQRRAQFAKVARQRFDKHEQMIRPAIEQAIGEYLDHLSAKIAPKIKTLTAAGEPSSSPDDDAEDDGDDFTDDDADALMKTLSDATAWKPLLDKHIMPAYSNMLDEILSKGLHDQRTSAQLMKWRNDWLGSRRQLLVGVPDDISGQLRTALSNAAAAKGTSVDDAAGIVQTMLDKGYQSWQGRADTIARTETVGANNQGSLASWSALSDSTGATATKTWLATEDSRTRPDHADMDGTEVGIKDTFDFGDSVMNGPGDPDGDPGQVVNCRCTLTYDFPDGTSGDQAEDEGDGDEGDLTAAAEATPTAGPSSEGDTEPEDSAPSGVAIMLVVGLDDSKRLAAPGVPQPDPPGFHCTVGYLSEPVTSYTPEQQAALVSALAPINAGISADILGPAHFNVNDPERDPCAVLLVQSDELASLHDAVQTAFATAGVEPSTTFPIWVPHVTVGYNVDPEIIPADLTTGSIAFASLVVGWGGTQVPVSADPAGEDVPEALTAAQEEPVTAPAAPPAPAAAPTAPPEPTTPGADGGDTSAAGADTQPQGVTWSGPIAMLGVPSSDGRVINGPGLVVRPLPLPLSWQKESGPEHDDSVVVGRLLSAEVRGNVLWGTGDFLDPMINFDAEQAMAQVDAGLGLVSVDLAVIAMGYADANGEPIDPILWDGDDGDINMVAIESELGGVTIVSFPAFAEVRIALDQTADTDAIEVNSEVPIIMGDPGSFAGASPEPPVLSADGSSITLGDGSTVKVGDPVDIPSVDGSTSTGTISGIDSSASTVTVTPAAEDDGTQPPDQTVNIAQLSPATNPPPGKGDGTDDTANSLTASGEIKPYAKALFERPEPDEITPLTYDPETRAVYGHLAEFGTCHVGKLAETGQCVTPPHSQRDYSDFHLGTIFTDAGTLDVGKITVGTGHAAPGGGFANAVSHYDNTGSQVAVVRASDGKHGVWVCGQAIHDVDMSKIEEMLRSPLSGDWRARNGNLELCAALAVNVPGFAVKRPTPVVGMSRGGKIGQLSLVASGVVMPRRGRVLDRITLPSGESVSAEDFESLVAAAATALSHGRRPSNDAADALRLRKARLAQKLRNQRVSV